MMKDDSPPSSPTMMFDDNESMDDELPSLDVRLQLNKDTHYSETSLVCDTSSSSLFSTSADESSNISDKWNEGLNHINGLVPEASSSPSVGNKKRQCGDKNSEQIGKPKRTCLNESHTVDKLSLSSCDGRTRNVKELKKQVSDNAQKFTREKNNLLHSEKNHKCASFSSPALYDLRRYNNSESSHDKNSDIHCQEVRLSNKASFKGPDEKNKNGTSAVCTDSSICVMQNSIQTSNHMKDHLNLPSTSRSCQQSITSFPMKPLRFTPLPLGVHFIDSDSDGDANTVNSLPPKGSLKGGGSELCSENIKKNSTCFSQKNIYDTENVWKKSDLSPTESSSSTEALKMKNSCTRKDLPKCKNKSGILSERPFSRFRNSHSASSSSTEILHTRKTSIDEHKISNSNLVENSSRSTRLQSKRCQNNSKSDNTLLDINNDSENGDGWKSSNQDLSLSDSGSSMDTLKPNDSCNRKDILKSKNKSFNLLSERPFDKFRNPCNSSSPSSAEISQTGKTSSEEYKMEHSDNFECSSRSTRLQSKLHQNSAPSNNASEIAHGDSFNIRNNANSDDEHIRYRIPVSTLNDSRSNSGRIQRRQSRPSRTSIRHRQSGNPRHHGTRNSCILQNLANSYPDIFDAEESSDDTEFFTANSYSDSETGAESLILEDHSLMPNFPETRGASILTLHVGSSDDEVSVIFSSNSTSLDEESQNSQRRLRHQRGHVRRGRGRSSCRNRSHIGQDVSNSSPDPVEQVRQMEEDERLARMLQDQFDAEVNDDDMSDSHSVMDNSDNQESLLDIVDQFFGRLSPEEVATSRHRGRQQGRRSSSSRSPWQYAPENRGGARGRTRVPQGGQGRPHILPTARGRQTRRRNYVNPWMWQFARMLGLSQTHNHPNADHSGNDYEELLQIAENLGEAVPRGLRKTEINMLPTRIYMAPSAMSSSSDNANRDNSEENKECQVCLSDYETGNILRILPCFHEFHTTCIDPWLKINHTCPVCRVEVNLDQ